MKVVIIIASVLHFLFSQTWFIILTICEGLFIIWVISLPGSTTTVKELKISNRKFAMMVLQWCAENLGTIKYNYQLKIYYYRNKKFLGFFHCYNKQIVIYITPDLNLLELTDTIIHEYVHHLQFERKSNEKDYYKKLAEIGYWDNPYEVEARKIAKTNRRNCLDWVLAHI